MQDELSCIFQPSDLVRHFPGPAFSVAPSNVTVILNVILVQSLADAQIDRDGLMRNLPEIY